HHLFPLLQPGDACQQHELDMGNSQRRQRAANVVLPEVGQLPEQKARTLICLLETGELHWSLPFLPERSHPWCELDVENPCGTPRGGQSENVLPNAVYPVKMSALQAPPGWQPGDREDSQRYEGTTVHHQGALPAKEFQTSSAQQPYMLAGERQMESWCAENSR